MIKRNSLHKKKIRKLKKICCWLRMIARIKIYSIAKCSDSFFIQNPGLGHHLVTRERESRKTADACFQGVVDRESLFCPVPKMMVIFAAKWLQYHKVKFAEKFMTSQKKLEWTLWKHWTCWKSPKNPCKKFRQK